MPTSSATCATPSPSPSGLVLDDPRAQERVKKSLDVSVEHALETADVESGPRVFDPLIGVHKVTANLRAEPGLGLLLIFGGLLGLAPFFFQPGQPGPQH